MFNNNNHNRHESVSGAQALGTDASISSLAQKLKIKRVFHFVSKAAHDFPFKFKQARAGEDLKTFPLSSKGEINLEWFKLKFVICLFVF